MTRLLAVAGLGATLFLGFFLAGCETIDEMMSSSSSSSRSVAEEEEEVAVIVPVPDTSLFAPLEIGMSQRQVTDLIGPPMDQRVLTSGKQWIPFYFGSDLTRTVYFYKDEGRLVFDGAQRLYGIEYDPAEDGYNNEQ